MSGSAPPERQRTSFRDDQRGFWRTYSMVLVAALLLGAVLLVAQTGGDRGQAAADQRIESDLDQTAADILRTANASGRLRNASLYWTPTAERWHNADADPPNGTYYASVRPDHPLAPIVATAESSTGTFAMNVNIEYQNDGSTVQQRVVYQGPPGRHAVSETYRLVLQDDDRIVYPDGSTGCTLSELDSGACSGSYFVEDSFSGGNYAIVEVEVVLWRP